MEYKQGGVSTLPILDCATACHLNFTSAYLKASFQKDITQKVICRSFYLYNTAKLKDQDAASLIVHKDKNKDELVDIKVNRLININIRPSA
jgi:hypothetical protein